MKDAAPDTSSDVVLTADEIAELKAMKPKVGHTWYGFFVPAIAGWNRFWEAGVSEWAGSHTSFDVQGKPDRDIAGVQLMIQQQIQVVGTLAVDWVVFSEAMRKLHDAKIPSTSVVAPSSAYFPTTSTIMPDQTQNARDLVLPIAKKLQAEGIKEADIVLLTVKTPAFFDIARTIGFKEGVKSPEVQAACKLNLVAEKQVAAGVEESQAATAAALQQYPNAHVIAALGHWYAGASAAIRDAGRKDVWVVAFDLDKGTGADLLTGGWPVYVTYSLPIAQTGRADANVMGKILLGKRVPLIVKTVGTVTTPDNVEKSWSDNWGGEKMPF
jgi:ABC-type sugar transport system substrate-binding protein